jgi:hypothetical protein
MTVQQTIEPAFPNSHTPKYSEKLPGRTPRDRVRDLSISAKSKSAVLELPPLRFRLLASSGVVAWSLFCPSKPVLWVSDMEAVPKKEYA